MSADAKQALTMQALGLLNEQVQARIVHYKSDLETSPELDAITAQVVAQLQQMQAALTTEDSVRQSPEEIERAQIARLTTLLSRAFVKGEQGNLVTRNLKPIGRRIAKLFFESELHERTKGDKEKTIHHPEQGVYYVLGRYKNRIRAELEGFDYSDDDVKQATLDLLTRVERELQVAFLSRRSPELNRVMSVFTSVLVDFFQSHLAVRIDQMAKITVRNCRAAYRPNGVRYKIQTDCFQSFREEWQRLLMQQMVHFCGDELMAQLTQSSEDFREETIKFFTDPHIFSETCEVVCDALYDFLCLEGFLDLPVDWRVRMADEAARH